MKKQQISIPLNKLINRVGKYIYTHTDGAYKFTTSSNTCDVYITVYYQLSSDDQIPDLDYTGYNDLHEMNINVSLTTYQNKVRVNIHEVDPNHWTFGYLIIPAENLQDSEQASKLIYDKVKKKIANHYKDYLFLF